MEDMFKVRGTLKNPSGGALPELLLVIVDEDAMDEDDLLGLGMIEPDGAFKLSFLGSEFRQDAFEMESTPDLKLIVSAKFDGTFKPIFVRSFGDVDWDGGEADLGAIPLAGVNFASLKPIPDVEAIPGVTRRAERLEIDSAMARECIAEVGPIVERLTGWRGLLDGLKGDVGCSLSSYMLREAFAAEGIDPTSTSARLNKKLTELLAAPGAGCALYDPHVHTVIINRSIMKHVGIEALKVICGHELVHVGQFKHTPGLKAYNLAQLRTMLSAEVDMKELPLQASYMIELEGYAHYIEQDFLKKRYYPMSAMIYHASTFEHMIQAVLKASMDEVGTAQAAKANQYSEGIERYRARQVGDQPGRFSMDVGKLYKGAAFVPQG